MFIYKSSASDGSNAAAVQPGRRGCPSKFSVRADKGSFFLLLATSATLCD